MKEDDEFSEKKDDMMKKIEKVDREIEKDE